MKLIAIRYYLVKASSQYERVGCEELWYSQHNDFEKEMNNELLEYAAHYGYDVEVTGKIYSKDAK